MGEQLEGHELMNSGYKMSFGKDVPSTKVCSMKLGKADAKAFEGAVDNHYWYQLYLDDLPIWGMVGEVHCPRWVVAADQARYLWRGT